MLIPWGDVMESIISRAETLDVDEPVSKALDIILKTGTCAVITKDGEYFGIIDDRNIRGGISNPKTFKCGSASVRAPRIYVEDIKSDKLDAVLHKFLAGHFKALPVIEKRNGKEVPIGIITRADILGLLLSKAHIPNISVNTIMATPVYTVDVNETLGTVKRLMKTLNVHRFTVVDKGRVVGVISSFDLTMFIEKPKDRQSLQLIGSVKRPDDLRIAQFVREPLVLCNEVDMLPDVVKEMAEKKVSYALVIDDKERPIGVLSSTDIFKLVLNMIKPKPSIYISGLRGEDLYYYDDITQIISNVVEKFSKAFDFTNIHVRIKRGKSIYSATISLEVDGSPLHIKAESYDLEETIDELAYNLETQLRRIKDKRDKGKKNTPTDEI